MQAGSRYTKAYTYRTISGSQSSTQISALRYSGFSNAPTYHYTYTANGSIASQWESPDSPATFQYDTLGQLTEATLPTEDLTYYYSYDDAGNLLQVSASGFAHGSDDYVNTYSYSNADWPDLLTAFNGQPIVYEGQTYALLTHIATGVSTVSNIRGSVRSGNPISYYNGVRWTFQWENGRWLSSAANSDTSLQFSYDLNGYRTAKTVNGVRHTYLYAGGKLLRETYSGNTLDFAYDAQGLPFSLTYNGTKYYYITNLQGDVMYLINSSGAKVASYAYDPYGKLTLSSGSMALINPPALPQLLLRLRNRLLLPPQPLLRSRPLQIPQCRHLRLHRPGGSWGSTCFPIAATTPSVASTWAVLQDVPLPSSFVRTATSSPVTPPLMWPPPHSSEIL